MMKKGHDERNEEDEESDTKSEALSNSVALFLSL